jgi:hypothetical protein
LDARFEPVVSAVAPARIDSGFALVVLPAGSPVYSYMKTRTGFRLISAFVLAAAISAVATAQDRTPQPQGGQNGGGYGQRGGRGGFGGMMGGGLMGTVTAAAPDQYTIKTDAGEVYTVHLSADTRIFKMPSFQRREGGQGDGSGQGNGAGQGNGGGQGRGMGGNPPQQLKASDIKVGDVIDVRGQVDEAAKSVPAMAVVQLDPDQVARIREMNANFGKTWLMGKVTAINDAKVTLTGSIDNASHSFVADENTTFRRRREPITLADIQVGDVVRVEGGLKDGVFTATTVNSMGAPGENPNAPRNPPAVATPPAAAAPPASSPQP